MPGKGLKHLLCPRCGREGRLGSAFRRRDGGVCVHCANAAATTAANAAAKRATATEQATPLTLDVVLGHEPQLGGDHRSRERIVRVQRVHSQIRLMAGVRLDQNAVHVVGTFTVPCRKIAELQRALTRMAAPTR